VDGVEEVSSDQARRRPGLPSTICCAGSLLAALLASCSFSYDSSDKSFGGKDTTDSAGRPQAPGPDTVEPGPDTAVSPADSGKDAGQESVEPRSGSCEVLLQCAMTHNFCGFLSDMFRKYPSDECTKDCLGGTADDNTKKQYMDMIRCGGQKCGELYLKGDAEAAAKCVKEKCQDKYEGLCEFTYY
jgi:hypothetical protein